MKIGISVSDAMTRSPVTVDTETSLKECVRIMQKEDVNSLLIRKEDKLLGIITDEDFVRKVVLNSLDPEKTKVKEVMVTKLVTIKPENDLYAAMRKMSESRCIKQLPVVKGGKLVGLLTWRDIVKIEPTLIEIYAEKFRLKEENIKLAKRNDIEGRCENCNKFSRLREAPGGQLLCFNCINRL